MTTMANGGTNSGNGVSLPRRAANAKLNGEQKVTLGESYLSANDEGRAALIRKWGRGRIRRSLLELARVEHEREYQARRLRDDI